ncbi:hypothetical protein naam_109 [Escherichia phage naam]|uniref:Uncharacterized protein n=1 Tax=Escherichia phage naam TaxID=2696427 RepID=A0A6B9XB21_9CAUD|nr:hypothetical protein naam_109 [Escherichia phage naam]
MKGNATHLGNVAINDAEAITLVEKAMAGALEHKEEYEKMMVNLAGAAAGEFCPKNNSNQWLTARIVLLFLSSQGEQHHTN